MRVALKWTQPRSIGSVRDALGLMMLCACHVTKSCTVTKGKLPTDPPMSITLVICCNDGVTSAACGTTKSATNQKLMTPTLQSRLSNHALREREAIGQGSHGDVMHAMKTTVQRQSGSHAKQ